MDCYISRHSLYFHSGINQTPNVVRAVIKRFKVGERKRVGKRHTKLVRHCPCHGVNVGIRHSQRSAHVSYCRAGGKRSVSGYLRNVILAVFIIHISDDLVTSVIAEININIGHTDSLGVKKPLKEQIEFY